ncbi:MAG: prolyl oligopeptidase family serine peptidase, partial [Clostridium sp.]|uniref:prolyl oligopeptidase family serine peptidase n=1 Tax=Clostridium sp. TaxID=1506 RepID=UPI002906C615
MLNKKLKRLVCATVTSMMLFSTVTAFADELGSGEQVTAKSISVTGTYDIIVRGFDWGPGVTQAVITLDNEVSDVNKDTFKVKETKQGMAGIEETERIILNAYVSDENGNRVEGVSKNVTIELAVGPEVGNPFVFSFETFANSWADPYYLNVTLANDSKLKVGDKVVDELNIRSEYVNRKTPTVDAFKEETYAAEGDISMKYAHYSPEFDNKKNPLIIWLHGAGEGGSDTLITTLGNEVGELITPEIQDKFGGAYVLTPQSPTMWMDSGSGEMDSTGKTIYAGSLMNLIKSYVNSSEDIDTNRIYVGGCSNGGYMTMKLILDNPEYFAAAYPICEPYSDAAITDKQLEGIENLPIWFTYALGDELVDSYSTSIATAKRLKAIGNKNVKISEFEKVIDTSGLYKNEDGSPYEYNAHWSWIYAFNDECVDGDDSLWSWLSEQEKVQLTQLEPSKPMEKPEKPGDDNIEKPGDDNIEKPEEPSDDVIEKPEEPDNNRNDSSISTGKDELPNTGAPISSMSVVIMGVLSTAVGIR